MPRREALKLGYLKWGRWVFVYRGPMGEAFRCLGPACWLAFRRFWRFYRVYPGYIDWRRCKLVLYEEPPEWKSP